MLERLQGLAAQVLPQTRKASASPPAEAATEDQFTPTSPADGILEVGRKSLVIGAGLTLAGVPLPVSAGVAAVHFVSEAAPETTGKVLSGTAFAATSVVALAATVASPVAEVAGTFVQNAMGHDFLPGFSG
jgi:hypothetical protein